MILKYEQRFVAFTWPNLCLWIGNFVFGICKLKPKKTLKTENPKKLKIYFFVKNPRFFLPALVTAAVEATFAGEKFGT